MSNSQVSIFSASFIRIHLVITRALKVILENSPTFAQQGFPDEKTRLGFVCYVQSWLSLLNAHHIVEDEKLFPFFCDKMPDKNFQALTDQHNWMIPILDVVKTSQDKAARNPQPRDALNDITAACAKISELWRFHSRTEESYFSSERVNALVDPQEQIKLNQLIAEYSQKLSGPDYLVIPFTLYNLPPQERAIMYQTLPAVVTEQLETVTWKEKWEPMQPFLLV